MVIVALIVYIVTCDMYSMIVMYTMHYVYFVFNNYSWSNGSTECL